MDGVVPLCCLSNLEGLPIIKLREKLKTVTKHIIGLTKTVHIRCSALKKKRKTLSDLQQ